MLRKRAVTKALRRLVHASLYAALGGWAEHVRYSRRSHAIVERLLLRWTQRGAAEALSSWRVWTAESMARKHGLRKAVHRMQLMGKSLAFVAWHESTELAQRLAAVTSRVIARLQSSCVVGAYARWAEYATQCRRVKRVGLRLQNLGTRRVLLAWVDAVEATGREREQESLKRAGEEHAQSLALMRAEIEAQRQKAVAAICVRWVRQGVSKCWESW